MNEYNLGLREAGDEELESIIGKAQQYLPPSFTVHNLLSTGFRRKLVDRNHTRIYLPVSDKLPFFVVIRGPVTKRSRNSMTPFWDPNEVSIPNAKTLMKSIPNWDWEQPVLFSLTSKPTLLAMKEILLGEGGLSHGKLFLNPEDTHAYKLSTEDISCKSLNKDFILERLREDDASLVYKHWGYTLDTVEGIQRYLKSFPSMAAFVKVDSNEKDEYDDHNHSNEINTMNGRYKPVSWAVCRFSGEIGYTHTLPEYRNKGLCSNVTLALAKEAIKMKITPFVDIAVDNPASIKAHENIGFRKYCPIGNYIYLEKGMTWTDY